MRVAVFPFFLRVHWWEGPWSCGGLAWQRQFGRPQRVIRSARVPGSAKPAAARAAISAAMAAGRGGRAGGGGPGAGGPGGGGLFFLSRGEAFFQCISYSINTV